MYDHGHIWGGKGEEEKIHGNITNEGGVRTQAQQIWNIYMCPYIHVLQKKRTEYRFHNGRDLMTTGTLLTPPHYQQNLRIYPWRCQAS